MQSFLVLWMVENMVAETKIANMLERTECKFSQNGAFLKLKILAYGYTEYHKIKMDQCLYPMEFKNQPRTV